MITTPEQISKHFAAPIRIENISVPLSSSSIDITTEIQNVLLTAGENNQPVPFQVSNNNLVEGVVTLSPFNKTEIYSNQYKNKFDVNGKEVYGKVTELSGVYTLSFFYLVLGVETSYVFNNNEIIDIEFNYNFSFYNLPYSAFVALKARNQADDPDGGLGSYIRNEQSSRNVFSDISSVSGIVDALDKILYPYQAPQINSFTNNINIVEFGTPGGNVTLSGTVTRKTNPIISLSINQSVGAVGTPPVNSSQSFNTITTWSTNVNKTWILTINDGVQNVTSSTSVIYRHKRYWGVSNDPNINDAGILAFNQEFATNRQQSRIFNASGEYLYFAYPASFGALSLPNDLLVGNLPNSAWTLISRLFANANGYLEPYLIYRTNTIQFGTGISVQVL